MTVVCRHMAKAGGLRAFPLGVIRVPTWILLCHPGQAGRNACLECTFPALKAGPRLEQ